MWMWCNGCDDNNGNFCVILGFSQDATSGHMLLAMVALLLTSPRGQENDNCGGDGDSQDLLSATSLSSRLYPFCGIRCAILIGGFPLMHCTRSLLSSNCDDAISVARMDDVESSLLKPKPSA